jgi:hypothetical protein
MSLRRGFFASLGGGLAFEPETIAYLTNAALDIQNNSTIYFASTPQEIAGSLIWENVESFVVKLKNAAGLPLKTNNLSTKYQYIFPFIGATAAANLINLVTGLTYGALFGGVSHDPDGISFNGTNAYMNTAFVPSSLNPNYYGYFYHVKSYVSGVLFGAYGTSSIDGEFPAANTVSLQGGFRTGAAVDIGNKSIIRVNSSQIIFRTDGVQQTIADTYNSGVSLASAIGARNENPNPTSYSNCSFQMFGLIKQPTLAEIILVETAMLDLQTALNR